jgi:hypothetical protein
MGLASEILDVSSFVALLCCASAALASAISLFAPAPPLSSSHSPLTPSLSLSLHSFSSLSLLFFFRRSV